MLGILDGFREKLFHLIILQWNPSALNLLKDNHSKSNRFKKLDGSNAGFSKYPGDAQCKCLLFDPSVQCRGHALPMKIARNVQMIKMPVRLECNKTNNIGIVFGQENDVTAELFMPVFYVRGVQEPTPQSVHTSSLLC